MSGTWNSPPHETLELEVSYFIYGYNGRSSTEKHPPYFDTTYTKDYLQELQKSVSQMYPYVTKTAGSWAGEVQSAQFIIRDADFKVHLRKRGAFEKDDNPNISTKDRKPQDEFSKPFNNGTFYRYISAGNWQPSADGKSLTWIEAPFNNHQDFEIRYIFSVLPTNRNGFINLLESTEASYEAMRNWLQMRIERAQNLNEPENQERVARTRSYLQKHYPAPFADVDRKNVADVVLEFYGIQTNNPDIADFLVAQSWYPVKQARPIDAELHAELLRWHKGGQAPREPSR